MRGLQAVSEQRPVVVWFRQDLRLTDQAAVAAAAGRPMVALYVLDDAAAGAWAMGGASRWWLHHSLVSLGGALAARGVQLVLRRGSSAAVIPAVMEEARAEVVHAGRMHEPWGRRVEDAVAAALPAGALQLHRTATLFDLGSIRTKTDGVYGMYTPFARALLGRGPLPPPLPVPDLIGAAPLASDRVEDWALLPTRPDWAGGMRATWRPGEVAAQARLTAFAGGAVRGYDLGRNLPGQDGTSMLSAHLHWGELSPGQVWDAAAGDAAGIGVYRSELLWREFAAYLLWHHPDLPEAPLRPAFARLQFREDAAALEAWQRGRTGVPIVDAGMRQLWQTGWMHNRVRMIVASFLVKHLLLSWRAGEDWFWDTLVDADLASNAASWQWVAGTGIDSQPFFRVFNPVSQGEKFDTDGAYVRRYVPEVARLPDRWLHAPWTAPADVLAAAGLALGRDYPPPIVDLASGRARALEAYRAIREAAA